VRVGPDPRLRAGLKQSSIPAGVVPQGNTKNLEAIVLRALPPEPVQVHLSAPLTASLNEMRATVDSKAAPVPAVLAAEDPVAALLPAGNPAGEQREEVPEVADSEDSMAEAEYVVKILCNIPTSVACFRP
jgi:hypothetical protein